MSRNIQGTPELMDAVQDLLNAVVTERDAQEFGAIGDGTSHPLGQYFGSLILAQMVYPGATSLAQEIDWAAVMKASDTVAAAGGGTVRARGILMMSDETVFPHTVDCLGEGFRGTIFRLTSAAARIGIRGRGGVSGNFRIEAQGIAANCGIFECTNRTFLPIEGADSTSDMFLLGTTRTGIPVSNTGTLQNCVFMSLTGENAGGSIQLVDGGAANNDFYGSKAGYYGGWAVKIQRSAASPPAGGTQPFNNRWLGGILERPQTTRAPLPITLGQGVVSQSAGSDNVLDMTTLAAYNGGTGTLDLPIVDVSLTDAGANTSRLTIRGPAFMDGDPGNSTGVRAHDGGTVRLEGQSFLRNVKYALDFDDNSTIYQGDLTFGTPTVNRYRQRGAQKAPKRIPDLMTRPPGWPTDALAVTEPRNQRLDPAGVLLSGTLYLTMVSDLFPPGVPIDEVHFVSGTTAGVGITNQWACIVSPTGAPLTVYAKTADKGAEAWPIDTDKTFSFASPYIPTAEEAFYIGIVVVAGTVPTLMSAVSRQGIVAINPRVSGPSTAGLTDPASLGATAAVVGIGGNVPFAYLK